MHMFPNHSRFYYLFASKIVSPLIIQFMEQQQFNIRMDAKLYQMAKNKCKNQFGIGLAPLVKIFLKSFVTQSGVGFFVGDEDLRAILARWLSKKRLEKEREGCAPLPGPRLKDIYDLK